MAFNTRTMFHPDEHQQSVEIAYDLVYGGGNLTWEWDPDYALRPILHPLIYAVVFKILKLLCIDFTTLIIYCPNLMHALLWFVSERYLYEVIKIVYTKKVATLTILVHTVSWFPCVLMARTFSNTIEASLLPVGVYLWLKISGSDKTIIDKNAIFLTVVI